MSSAGGVLIILITIFLLFITVMFTKKGTTMSDTNLGRWSKCTREMRLSEREIFGFCGSTAFLSNFFPTPVTRNNLNYGSSEAAYQAAKYDDKPEIQQLFTTVSADDSKKLVKKYPYNEAAFTSRRIDVMRDILIEKFKNAELRQRLVDTGSANLVEYNWWGDQFWGQTKDGGRNELGRLLMTLRSEIINEPK
jgi:ribA/ribD-fused uncharacterized protein